MIDTSDILYIEPNKKRTDSWLMRTRLQLPFGITNYGSIKSVTYPNENVNTYSMQNGEKDSHISHASKGKKAETERSRLLDILEVEKNGKNTDRTSKASNEVFSGNWTQQAHGLAGGGNGLPGSKSGVGNATVLQGKPSANGSRAFRNVIESLFKISSEGRGGRDGISHSIKKGDNKITRSVVETIQSIGRKPVSDFTSDDMKKVELFAKKYFEEMGVKSPFFRAWFGDWRANDETSIPFISVNAAFIDNRGNIPRGEFLNQDTGWKVKSTSDGIDETSSKKTKYSDEYHSLKNIDDMISNAILLDTVVVTEPSKRMGKNAIFVHHLYCPILIEGKKAIAKLYVTEDIFDTKRFYLTKIEKVSVDVGLNSKETVPDEQNISTDTNISISEIYDFVKKNDKKYEKGSKEPTYFNPKPTSKVVNKDGTPMIVYHGTDAEFNVFDMSKGRANMDIQGSFFSPWELDAKGYGKNVGAYYLSIKKPADGQAAFAALNRFKGQDNAGIKARDYLIKQGYDGVNFYDEEYVAFYPTQIKSATDNIGTFDKSNPDIYHSLKGESQIMRDYDLMKRGKLSQEEFESRYYNLLKNRHFKKCLFS